MLNHGCLCFPVLSGHSLSPLSALPTSVPLLAIVSPFSPLCFLQKYSDPYRTAFGLHCWSLSSSPEREISVSLSHMDEHKGNLAWKQKPQQAILLARLLSASATISNQPAGEEGHSTLRAALGQHIHYPFPHHIQAYFLISVKLQVCHYSFYLEQEQSTCCICSGCGGHAKVKVPSCLGRMCMGNLSLPCLSCHRPYRLPY